MNAASALGLIQAGEDLNMKMGSDYHVIGYDDDPSSRMVVLTSMRSPIKEIGEELARLIIEQLNGLKLPGPSLFYPTLVPRRSTER